MDPIAIDICALAGPSFGSGIDPIAIVIVVEGIDGSVTIGVVGRGRIADLFTIVETIAIAIHIVRQRVEIRLGCIGKPIAIQIRGRSIEPVWIEIVGDSITIVIAGPLLSGRNTIPVIVRISPISKAVDVRIIGPFLFVQHTIVIAVFVPRVDPIRLTVRVGRGPAASIGLDEIIYPIRV